MKRLIIMNNFIFIYVKNVHKCFIFYLVVMSSFVRTINVSHFGFNKFDLSGTQESMYCSGCNVTGTPIQCVTTTIFTFLMVYTTGTPNQCLILLPYLPAGLRWMMIRNPFVCTKQLCATRVHAVQYTMS